MRIVQTFWTAGRDPLTHGFGWTHPEYNLMSWALSCLSLREHYDEVALYTDAQGKHVLIDLLHLPYTEVHVVYDETLCLPQHWAYAKIKTYSLQTKPFLHVDGDVYLPKPIPEDILNAPLIAQNREIGTSYYQRMMKRVFKNPAIILPLCVKNELDDGSLSSYNMGLFGGNDLDFVHRYCSEVFKFLTQNDITTEGHINSKIECNVFFEQIILAAMADEKGLEVGSIVSHPMYDQGYTISEFCNLREFEDRPVHHLLGGHKRNPRVTRMLAHAMMRKHPDMFYRIHSICPICWRKCVSNVQSPCEYEKELKPYFSFLEETLTEWRRFEMARLLEMEMSIARNDDYSRLKRNDQELILMVHPYLKLFTPASDMQDTTVEELRKCLRCGESFPISKIAVIPAVSETGYQATALLPIDVSIIDILNKGPLSKKELNNLVIMHYYKGEASDLRSAYINEEVEYLVKCGLILQK